MPRPVSTTLGLALLLGLVATAATHAKAERPMPRVGPFYDAWIDAVRPIATETEIE